MKIETVTKETLTLIGRSKFVQGGSGVKDIWEDANCHFDEVFGIAKKNSEGKLVGVWGAMSDSSMNFNPWEKNFSEGYYLAGVECEKETAIPQGWTKWTLPGFRYLSVKVEKNYQLVMQQVLSDYMPQHQLKLVGAIQEFYAPTENGQLYLYFPFERV